MRVEEEYASRKTFGSGKFPIYEQNSVNFLG